ncbi:MAG: PEP/pyruvate-binding domain-containing protein [Candidatus Ratteibacteria bacterium]|nr:PEP/pyruvate-binding domain-containing protein [Candidatus Ratteibacteria bacterium]
MAIQETTGLTGLDSVLDYLRKGDNVVWQVDKIEDFQHFVTPFVAKAKQDGRKVIYIRFAKHKPLVEPDSNVTIYELNAKSGFEIFSSQVYKIISREKKNISYVFDCLSDLLDAWATDLMIGNFFMVTCPYLFELESLGYFALIRNNHSFKTVARIRETTQLLLDVYNFEDNIYVHPLKAWKRYSPKMFFPHLQKGEQFVPITNSVDAARLISHVSEQGLEPAQRVLDYWDRLFMQCEKLSQDESISAAEKKRSVKQLCRIMIGREKRILSLAESHFSLEDLLSIRSRMIGTGFIGGKAVGMLLANNIVSKDTSYDWKQILEPHDSFYVGSDVFYSYIVENGWWKLRMEQKTKEGYFHIASELRRKMLKGKFPDQICEQFQAMIEYFGQSPIIVRSSSLLEDAFGNAFAGKYASFFLANQGSPEERYNQFESAVRKVYASTMNENALAYRLQRGLEHQDEQMALLIQRVSGSHRKKYFFPDLAGVGVSYDTFAWNPELDPKAGMLRLVFGLGTRAVNRVDDDYPRIIALDAPLLRPLAGMDDIRKYSQRHANLIDTEENNLKTVPLQKLFSENPELALDSIVEPDFQMSRKMRELGMKENKCWLLTFKKLLSDTSFIPIMQKLLQVIENQYQYPVDIEFTANFKDKDKLVINLLQCRPLQTKGLHAQVKIPPQINPQKILFSCEGYFMGGSISLPIKKIIYVDPKAYSELSQTEKYDIARIVGKLNKQITDKEIEPTILLGPGRWGTTTPSLGVPVNFYEINNISVMVEIAYEGGNLMPDLSFGTHFFQDLIESDIFYIALFPNQEKVTFNKDWLLKMPNLLTACLPESEKYTDVIKVYETKSKQLQLMCDIVSQKVVCFSNAGKD